MWDCGELSMYVFRVREMRGGLYTSEGRGVVQRNAENKGSCSLTEQEPWAGPRAGCCQRRETIYFPEMEAWESPGKQGGRA